MAVAIEAQSCGLLKVLATQDQRTAGHQSMDVVAIADAKLHAPLSIKGFLVPCKTHNSSIYFELAVKGR